MTSHGRRRSCFALLLALAGCSTIRDPERWRQVRTRYYTILTDVAPTASPGIADVASLLDLGVERLCASLGRACPPKESLRARLFSTLPFGEGRAHARMCPVAVLLLVGTWKVDGPHHLGAIVHHLVLDPRDRKTLLMAARTGHLGPTVFRSTDRGKTWVEAKSPPKFPKAPEGKKGRVVDHTFWLTPSTASEPGLVGRDVAAGPLPERGPRLDLGAGPGLQRASELHRLDRRRSGRDARRAEAPLGRRRPAGPEARLHLDIERRDVREQGPGRDLEAAQQGGRGAVPARPGPGEGFDAHERTPVEEDFHGFYDESEREIAVPLDGRCNPQWPPRRDHSNLRVEHVLLHEITHQLMHDALATCPHWLSEGLAGCTPGGPCRPTMGFRCSGPCTACTPRTGRTRW
jgi:hypothetical protein